MSGVTSIRIPDDLQKKLKTKAQLEHRSLNNQIEVSLRLALVAEENPDLPLQLIKDILQARAEKEAGLAKPFKL
jgi:plasmid stability protein